MPNSEFNQSNQWKDKYLASLDAFESKERVWEQNEATLRQAISRLTLAVETADQLLTQQLELLRTTVRKPGSSMQIANLIEEISASILRIDQQLLTTQQDEVTAIQVKLTQIDQNFAQINTPAGLRRLARDLQQQLNSAQNTGELQQIIDLYLNYISKMLAWIASFQQPKIGLLQRWFGRNNFSTKILNHSENIKKTEQKHTVTINDENNVACQQILLDLLRRLDFPEEVAEQFQQVTLLLQNCDSSFNKDCKHVMNRVVADIVDLLAKTRQHSEREKKDLETFLAQLTERLETIDHSLQHSGGKFVETMQSSHLLDHNFSNAINGMRQAVSETEEITQLQHSIKIHLANIQQQMDARKNFEQELLKHAETEVAQLGQALIKLREESRDLHARLEETRARTAQDNLTGLHNRLAYDERIQQEAEKWAKDQCSLVLSIWDVDYFKRINDQYGHQAGDNVLKILGGLLKKHTRTTDFSARFGGEKFILLLPDTDLLSAFESAEKLRLLIATSKFVYRGQPVPVTMSCGLAELIAADTPDSLYNRADAALYEAKQLGRNCCRIYGQAVRAAS